MSNKPLFRSDLPNLVFGLDPGSAVCGTCLLDSGQIKMGFQGSRTEVFCWIRDQAGGNPYAVVIEDIFPYSRLVSRDVIDTCKAIGELTYRFHTDWAAKIVRCVPRMTVKKWVYDTFPDLCREKLPARMEHLDRMRVNRGQKSLKTADGMMRAQSFNFVDDRIIATCMRQLYEIPVPKPGKQNLYGLGRTGGHIWQALAVASHFFHTGEQ